MLITRRTFLQSAGMGTLGFAVFGVQACSKPRRSSPDRLRIERQVERIARELQTNPRLREIDFMGRRLQLGQDDVTRILNSELERVGSEKCLYLTGPESGKRANVLFGDADMHYRTEDGIDIIIFSNNEIVTNLPPLSARSNIFAKISIVRKKMLEEVWSKLGCYAFDERDLFASAILSSCRVGNREAHRNLRERVVGEWVEEGLQHELFHHRNESNRALTLRGIRDNFIEVHAAVEELKQIINAQNARLALLSALRSYGAKKLVRNFLFLTITSSMEWNRQRNELKINFSRLISLVETFSIRWDQTLQAGLGTGDPNQLEQGLRIVLRELLSYPVIGVRVEIKNDPSDPELENAYQSAASQILTQLGFPSPSPFLPERCKT